LDVDVARYVAKELGFEGDKVIFKETPSAQRETAIQGGQVALFFATYSITDARKEKVSFAGPYFMLVRTCWWLPITPPSPDRRR
jgi:glutamate transport system substrate-binding protein